MLTAVHILTRRGVKHRSVQSVEVDETLYRLLTFGLQKKHLPKTINLLNINVLIILTPTSDIYANS